jgi:predicted transcriptional regulator
MLTLQLPKGLERRLDQLAARTGKPTSFYAETAIRDFSIRKRISSLPRNVLPTSNQG